MNTTCKRYYAILFVAVMISSCERSIDVNSKSANVKLAAANAAASNKCRLVYANFADGYITETYGYNAEGLVNSIRHEFWSTLYSWNNAV